MPQSRVSFILAGVTLDIYMPQRMFSIHGYLNLLCTPTPSRLQSNVPPSKTPRKPLQMLVILHTLLYTFIEDLHIFLLDGFDVLVYRGNLTYALGLFSLGVEARPFCAIRGKTASEVRYIII